MPRLREGEATLAQEEVQFRRTLVNGLRLLDETTADMGEGGTLPGATAFSRISCPIQVSVTPSRRAHQASAALVAG